MIAYLRRLALAPFFLFPACFPYFSQIEKDRERAIARFPRGNVMRRVQGVDMHYMRAGSPQRRLLSLSTDRPGLGMRLPASCSMMNFLLALTCFR